MEKQRCGKHAALRFTWPGRDEDFICIEHAPWLAKIAQAMGMHLQMIPLTPCKPEDHPTCSQMVSEQATSEAPR